jgi:ubiquinone/menaquinone biosynthesis C-methylase UbiE
VGVGTKQDALVQGQYEEYPYPERNPADERQRLIEGSPSDLAEIRHYLFAGRMPNQDGEPFRALIAGGGTGDAAIMLAQQCATAGLAAEIVHLDLSTASRAVAEARAKVRGLTNLRFVTGSLLKIGEVAPGPYDYIDCCGVLHHLDQPAAGLASLMTVLKPTGGMGLMVYGTLGRRGVYEMQEVLRLLAPANLPGQERIKRTRQLLATLPKTNWLRRNPFVGDHRDGTDAGLYDLLLHARDRAYRVQELANLLAEAGLDITAFIQPAAYMPETYLSDPAAKASVQDLSLVQRAAMAEALAGNMRKHVIYAAPKTRADEAVATTTDTNLVPTLHRQEAKPLAATLRNGSLKVSLDGFDIAYPAPNRSPAVVSRIDGRRSLSTIAEELRAVDTSLSSAAAAKIVDDAFRLLNGLNLVLLRSFD